MWAWGLTLLATTAALERCPVSRCVYACVEQDGSEGDSRYLAPEVLQGGKTSKRPPADVFSLGMSAFELVWNVVLVGRGAAWADLRKGKLPDIDPTLGRSPDLIRLVTEVGVARPVVGAVVGRQVRRRCRGSR